MSGTHQAEHKAAGPVAHSQAGHQAQEGQLVVDAVPRSQETSSRRTGTQGSTLGPYGPLPRPPKAPGMLRTVP